MKNSSSCPERLPHPVWRLLLAGVAGLLFGFGLLLAQMVSPARVLAFLDVLGDWDPALMLVMGGAVLVAAPAFWWGRQTRRDWCGATLPDQPTRPIDRRLVLGSLMFGVGWGVAGLCPGPALVSAATGNAGALLFSAAMLAGFALVEAVQRLTP